MSGENEEKRMEEIQKMFKEIKETGDQNHKEVLSKFSDQEQELKELNGRFEGIETEVKDLAGDLKTISTKVEGQTERFAKIEKELEALKRGETELQSDPDYDKWTLYMEEFSRFIGLNPVLQQVGESDQDAFIRTVALLSVGASQVDAIQTQLV